MEESLDVVTVGRSSVDLYGVEIGTGLEDVDCFRKSVGGCPANIAIGAARLGLRSAILTRVGDEQMGRFILSEMKREGVITSGIRVDGERLTALVLLAVRDRTSFPHIFYRENCADMALCEDDVDPLLIARSQSIVVTGTHFSSETVAAASWKAIRLAKKSGARIVFDIDFRPSLWGLAPHSDGDARLVLSDRVRDVLRAVISASDVIVGTEEEFRAATNEADLTSALATARDLSGAIIVCKRGASGCEIYPNADRRAVGEAVRGNGFEVRVINTIGAGDAFLSGFLCGWLRGESWETTATWANACGAIAVSRLLCSTEYPTWAELGAFMEGGRDGASAPTAPDVAHIHRVTTRRYLPDELFVLAADHRWQFEELADRLAVDRSRLSAFKKIAVSAAGLVSERYPNVGVICDEEYGSDALFDAGKRSLWTARSIEEARSKPLRFATGPDIGSTLVTWPRHQTVKCLCHYDPNDPKATRDLQDAALVRLDRACKALRRELLLEIISGSGHDHPRDVARTIRHLYQLGVRPEWWKLEPFTSFSAWNEISEVISTGDRYCRGVLILGLTSSADELGRAFEAASTFRIVRGFAVGRAIFGEVVEAWLSGDLSDGKAQASIAARFEAVIEAWRASGPMPARQNRPERYPSASIGNLSAE